MEKEVESKGVRFKIPELPIAELSPTGNPNVFWNSITGELYYLDPEHRYGYDKVSFTEPRLIKLNNKRG